MTKKHPARKAGWMLFHFLQKQVKTLNFPLTGGLKTNILDGLYRIPGSSDK